MNIRRADTGKSLALASPHGPQWPPRVQAAGVSSLEEALFCVRVGIDALGFTLGLPDGVHDGLTETRAASIIRALPPGTLSVVITYEHRADEACSMVRDLRAHAIQFHGGISSHELSLFRSSCPHIRTIGRLTVSGREAVQAAGRFRTPDWDALILDSVDPSTGRVGATGIVHDWSVSAACVVAAEVPVILAGGLTPENVKEAVQTVKPAGVDAHTGLENPDGTRSFTKIAAFARAALEAFGRRS
jgi:phosphoribosylanthranilate isomerase